ncbi:MAG: ankyrin repeat domain-containing protein [Aggregatilineales bacterium]
MSDQPQLTQELVNQFVIAAHHDLDQVRAMLAENPALLNENAEWFETPIQAAAHVGRRDIVEFLLEQGAPLDICTAAMLGRAEVVDALLAEDPGLREATGAHNIPLMYFPAIAGEIAIAERLLAAGVDLNAGEGVNTALHGAAIFGQTAMVRWLLDHDANPYVLDMNGKMPIDLAEQNHHEAAAALLRPFTETE